MSASVFHHGGDRFCVTSVTFKLLFPLSRRDAGKIQPHRVIRTFCLSSVTFPVAGSSASKFSIGTRASLVSIRTTNVEEKRKKHIGEETLLVNSLGAT